MTESPIAALLRALSTAHDMLAATSTVLEQLETPQFSDAAPRLDVGLRDVQLAIEHAVRYTRLWRPSRYTEYDPLTLLRERFPQWINPDLSMRSRPVQRCTGDPDQVADCLRVLYANAALSPGDTFSAAYFSNEGLPFLALGAGNERALPEALQLGDELGLSMEQFEERWTAATHGGEVARDGRELLLHFEGDAAVPPGLPEFASIADTLERVVQRLRPWRGAGGAFEEGMAGAAESLRLYREAAADARRRVEDARARLKST